MLDRSGEAAFAAVLRAHQLHAYISDNAVYCGQWRDHDRACDHGTFHLLDSGRCELRSAVLLQPLTLSAGDLVVFPHGAEHFLNAVEGAGEGEFTTMLCGEFKFATGPRNAIVDALPDCFVVREQDSGAQFRHLAQLMSQEAQRKSFAAQIVLDKLADAMFVMAVRHYIEAADERRGLLAALCDSRLNRVLAAMHSNPGRSWTVATLADIAHQSRTAFAQHFAAVLGVGPVQYLTEWRMAEALRLLGDPETSVAAVADRLGYQTEAAFRRAFKRVHGFGPGSQRRRNQAERRDLAAALPARA
jgi:AraC-like DNA-binding protein